MKGVYWIGESEDSNIFPDTLPEGLNGVVALTADDNFFPVLAVDGYCN